MNVLCLDIDDAILPSNNTYFGQVDDNFDIFELNMKRIQMMIQKYDMKVFITSSYSSDLTIDTSGELELKNISLMSPEHHSIKIFNIISKYLDDDIIGLSSGNRFSDISKLLEENYKVVAIDDTDLSEIEDKNFLFIETKGFITNDLTYKIDCFMKIKATKHNNKQLKKSINK